MIPNKSVLKILYEDDYLFIIEKPSGITVDNSETTKEGEVTVQDLLSDLRIERELLDEIDRVDEKVSADQYPRRKIIQGC